MYEKMDNGYGVRFYTFGLTKKNNEITKDKFELAR